MPKANVTDIVDRLRYSDIYDYADAVALCDEAAAEIERLRAALREIAKYEPDEGCPCNACRHSAIARAALEEK